MNNDLKEQVRLRIQQKIKGLTIETNKFEVKKQWYDLSWKEKLDNGKTIHNWQYYEFLKDCTSIINSYGREDGFIVIGVDNSNNLFDAPIKDSGFADPSSIKDIIIGNVDKAFLIDIDYVEVEGKHLAVIHIPPSADKPHLVQKYISKNNNVSENVNFVRNGSGTHVATRGDLDRMYYERSNILLDKKIEVGIEHIIYQPHGGGIIGAGFDLVLDNTGSRRILVKKIEVIAMCRVYSFKLEATEFYLGGTAIKSLRLDVNYPIEVSINSLIEFEKGNSFAEWFSTSPEKGADDVVITSMIFELGNQEKVIAIPAQAKMWSAPK